MFDASDTRLVEKNKISVELLCFVTQSAQRLSGLVGHILCGQSFECITPSFFPPRRKFALLSQRKLCTINIEIRAREPTRTRNHRTLLPRECALRKFLFQKNIQVKRVFNDFEKF